MKYKLSFREWAKSKGYDYWKLNQMDDDRYVYMWGVYQSYASFIRQDTGVAQDSNGKGPRV